MNKSLSSTLEAQPSIFKRTITSRAFHTFIGASVSILLLLWVFSDVDFAKLGSRLKSAHYWILLPTLFIFWLHFVIRALRWRYLLPNGGSVNFRASFDSTMVGCFANFVLPLRAGEFVRPYMLSKITPVSFAEGFASIVTERFFDLAASIITFALILPLIPTLPDWVSTSALALGVVSALILGFIVTVSLFPEHITAIYDRILPLTADERQTKLIPARIRRFLVDFINSAKILSDPKRLLVVVFLTALVWLSNYFLYYIMLFLLDIPHTFLLGTAVAVIIALAVAAPSAPGFIGVYQTACLAAFALYNIPEEDALVFSIISHLLQYVIFISYGVFALTRAGLKLQELRSRSEAEMDL